MENRKRKLLKLVDDGAPPSSLSPLRSPEEATASSSSELMTVGSPQATPPCDSSMALTIIVMLTALFFMAFFSILIRLFTDDSAPDISRRRPRYGDPRGVLSFSSRSAHYTASKRADPHAVQSLPVYCYGGMAKYQIDCCAICLNEFEDQEAVKVIPHCKHLFHVACIDTWLSSHVSCPVCRGTQLFDIKCGGLGALQEWFDEGETAAHRGSTADVNDTCIEVWREAEVGVRRTRSCSSLGERGSLQRTSSF